MAFALEEAALEFKRALSDEDGDTGILDDKDESDEDLDEDLEDDDLEDGGEEDDTDGVGDGMDDGMPRE